MATSATLFALDACVKATLLLGLTACAAAALRRGSAAARHLVWALGIGGSLALPLLGLFAPRWELEVLPEAWPSAVPVAQAPENMAQAAAPLAPRAMAATTERDDAAITTSRSRPHAKAKPDGVALLWLVWLAGAAIVLLPLGAGSARMWWRGRRGRPLESASWQALARDASRALGVGAAVRLLRGEAGTMPVAWGLLRPAVLLPEDAEAWPDERRRAVLTHELAHVKRRDCLTQAIAHVACAVYWFHPLVWLASARLRSERERACDDLVLRAGARGPDYADQLLELARGFRGAHGPALATVAMARPSQLEGRLLAILDPSLERRAPSPPAVAGALLLAFALAVPLAGMQPAPPKRSEPSPSALAESTATPTQPSTVELPTTPALAPSASAETASQAAASEEEQEPQESRPKDDATRRERIVAALSGALRDSDSEVRREAVSALGRLRSSASAPALASALGDTDAEVRTQAAFALGQIRSSAAVEALSKALTADANAEVRTQVAFALGQIRDESAVQALTQALKADANAEVRTQSAFALGQIRRETAVPGLSQALGSDSHPEVRTQAAFALGQIRAAAAVPALAGAVGDASSEVRKQAVFALGQIRADSGIEGLRRALRDADVEVRKQAAFALGQIRSKDAVPTLLDALQQDKDSNVREQAAFALGQIRDGSAVTALTAALKDSDASVRRQAAFALSQLMR